MLPLAAQGNDYVAPTTVGNIRSGRYPYARYLYIYVNKAPEQVLDSLTAAFMDRVPSTAGQSLVSQDGYLPLPEHVRVNAHQQLGL